MIVLHGKIWSLLKCKYSSSIGLSKIIIKKRHSHSFLNVHDSQTVLVHGTNAELMWWPQQKHTKIKRKGSCALVRQVNTTCNSQWHTQTHSSWGPGGRARPEGTKADENIEEHTHTHNHRPSSSRWSGVHRPRLVSQWTLLQPSWRMTQLDLSPATNTDQVRKKAAQTQHRLTTTRALKTILKSYFLAPVKIWVLITLKS